MKDKSRVKFGQMVARLRRQSMLTVEQLAEMAQLKPVTVQNIEEGAFNFPFDILNRIAVVMGGELKIVINKKTSKIMKVIETKDTMVCEAMEPSEKAMAICDAISNACKENDVAPSEIFPILGEALIRVLVNCAGVLGYDEVSYVHCFGKGLATCELEFKEKGN